MKADDVVHAASVEATESGAGAEGFVLEEVEMKGFMRYVAQTDPPLRFPEKFTVITGRTGSGKSSILDAITFALYGSTTRTDIQSVKTSDICQPGGHVRVAFRQGESRWEVRRGFTTRKESYLEVTRDGEAVPGTIHEKEATIKEVVGLDYVGFRNATFVRQEEMKDLGAARGADRLATFQNLFRLEVFEKALARAKDQLDVLRGDLQAKEADIAARTEALERLPKAREDLGAIQASIVRGRGEAAAAEGRLQEAKDHVQSLEGEHETWVRLLASLDDRRNQIETLYRRAEEVRRRGEEAATLDTERRRLEGGTRDLEDLRAELDRLRGRAQVHEQRELAARAAEKMFDQAKRDHERRRDQIKDRIDQLHRKIAGLRTEIDKETAFGLLRDEGRLEERIARIEREVDWLADHPDLLATLGEERMRTEKALARVREKTASIDEESLVLTELRHQLEDLKADLKRESEEGHATLQPLDDAKITALRQLDEALFSDEDRQRSARLMELIQEKTAQRKKLDALSARLRERGDVTTLLADLARQGEVFEAERRALETKATAVEPAEAAYRKAREDLEGLRGILAETRRSLHTLEGQATALAAQIEDLAADGERLKESERRRDGMREQLEIHEILVNRVFHKRGVVMFAVDQILPELEIEASRNLAELTAGRFHRIKLETYEEGRGHGIRILVQGVDGAWHDVGEFSGGEKTQINAALRFAIARELASMPQIGRTYGRMKTLFIDEGDLGSLDTEVSRELFVQKLFRMGEFFEKVILITHLAEVADRFPGRIQITMSPNQESRVEVLV